MSQTPNYWNFNEEKGIVDYNRKDFRQYWEGKSKALLHQAECGIIKELLPPTDGWFFDIGCGFGRFVPVCSKENRRLILVDYALNHLEMAAEKHAGRNIHFIAAEACKLPFRDEVFDGGICIRLFHHIATPGKFLHELSRVVRSDRSVLFTYLNRRSLLRILRYGPRSFRKNHKEVSAQIYGTHPVFFAELAREAGFGIQGLRGTGLVHQITFRFKFVNWMVENNILFLKCMALTERVADFFLGRLGLALMQYALLEKRFREAAPVGTGAETAELTDILQCPACGSARLQETKEEVLCPSCGKKYPKIGKVYDFRCV